MTDGIILLTGLIDQLKINKDKDMRFNAKGVDAIINWVDKASTIAVYVMSVVMFIFVMFQILR